MVHSSAMTPEKWQRIEAIYHDACERPPSERTSFLLTACFGQDDLRKDVEALLAAESESFLGTNALDFVSFDAPAPPRFQPDPRLHPLETRYDILDVLGAGGMGIVLKARDRETSELLALKVLKEEISANQIETERFKNELRLARRITHKNVCRVFEFNRTGTLAYISMEYVEGESLRSYLNRKGKLDAGEAIAILDHICSGLREAHRQGIIHGDLKPENLMIDSLGSAKILDFGVAQRPDGRFETSRLIIGTPAYMAPEQAEGRAIDARTDVYALGLILYETLTGQPVFSGDSAASVVLKQIGETPRPAREIDEAVPEQLDRLILRCLEKDPKSRFQSVDELEKAVRARRPNNLPAPVSSFVGRQQESFEIKSLLANHRLVTLSGAGGSGKTRLALRVASDLLDVYADGIWFVDLAPVSEPQAVVQALASALQIREELEQPLVASVMSHLRSAHLLVIMDNCEHLIESCARLVQTLLQQCSNVRLLATSREPLGLAGEVVWRVPPLTLPDLRTSISVEKLQQYEAVQLFAERAAAASPGFALTADNAGAVAEVCCRLDGIPLAIELAAVRVMALSAEQINSRLQDRFRLLTKGSRAALPRQQTLKATLDWSYNLLSDPERALFRRLSIFSGGWTMAEAEAICADDIILRDEVMDLLSSLVAKSMVQVESRDAEPRYNLLSTLTEYAQDRLSEAGDGYALRLRHGRFFAALAEDADSKMFGPDQQANLLMLQAEHDNLRKAIAFTLTEEPELALRIAANLSRFWVHRGYVSEGRRWIAAVLDIEGPPRIKVKALQAAGALAMMQNEDNVAQGFWERALELARRADFKNGIDTALNNLGICAVNRTDWASARTLFEESLQIKRELNDTSGIARSLVNLAGITSEQGDIAKARALWEEAFTAFRNLGDRLRAAHVMQNLASLALDERDYVKARSMIEETLRIEREFGDRQSTAESLLQLANLDTQERRFTFVTASCLESFNISQELGNKTGCFFALAQLSATAFAQENYFRCTRLQAAANALRRETAWTPLPRFMESYDRQIRRSREALGEKSFAAAWAEGEAMNWDQAIEYGASGHSL